MHQGLCIVPREAGSKCIIYMSFSFYLAQNSEPKQTVKNIKQLLAILAAKHSLWTINPTENKESK